MKKKILEKSDTWSTSSLSHQPSKPAYFIINCQITYFGPKLLDFVYVCLYLMSVVCVKNHFDIIENHLHVRMTV